MQAPTVTLLVTPEQAETLTLAGNDGHIQLVLRNSSDQTIEKTTGRYVSELYNAASPDARAGEVRSARGRGRSPVVVAAAASAGAGGSRLRLRRIRSW